MDRLLDLVVLIAVLALLAAPGCGKDADKSSGTGGTPGAAAGRTAGVAPAGRAAGVAGTAAVALDPKLVAGFCDKHWPGSGPDVKPFGAGPAARALDSKANHAGKWRWINFWATWCKPCLEEMPMLGRWRRRSPVCICR